MHGFPWRRQAARRRKRDPRSIAGRYSFRAWALVQVVLPAPFRPITMVMPHQVSISTATPTLFATSVRRSTSTSGALMLTTSA